MAATFRLPMASNTNSIEDRNPLCPPGNYVTVTFLAVSSPAVFVACSTRRHDLVAILPQELPCPDAAFRGGVERVADELVDTGVAQFVEPLGNQLFLTD